MAEVYNNSLKIGIGRVSAKTLSNNYFPVVGESIKITAETKWTTASEWQTKSTSSVVDTTTGAPVSGKEEKTIPINEAGELPQKYIAKNSIGQKEISKTIYAMEAQTLPYFKTAAKEILRVGDTNGYISVTPENGYSKTRERNIVIRVYKENKPEVFKTITNHIEELEDGTRKFPVDFMNESDRGIYDVEVDVTDVLGNTKLSQRHNKLITVTPKLCPKPADLTTGYEVALTYKARTTYSPDADVTFELKLWRNVDNSGLNYAEFIIPRGEIGNSFYANIPIASLPAGTTMCLKEDPLETAPYPHRLLLEGNSPMNVSNENGTPNFTREKPLVITHDLETVMEWGWRGYGAFQCGANPRNIVFDGFGYHNTGIHFFPFNNAMFTDSCIYVNNGATDFELLGLDVDGGGFAAFFCKTDPDVNMPWYWRTSGWTLRLSIHHCKMRNTVGEGVYIGYYDTRPKKGTNSAGQPVTYQAHLVESLRLYRCLFYQNGFDSVQINNGVDIEFCYNTLIGSGYRREPSQGSAFSCTSDGKIYNNIVKNNYNLVGVYGPYLSKLEVFNNILTAARMEPGWSLTKWSSDEHPETEITNLTYDIHNNVVKASRIAILNGNVVMRNHFMNDNIFITELGNTELPGYFTGSGNVFLQADLDYENIDNVLKVADSGNYDYQPAYNSSVVTAGRNGKSLFDYRGYKNWYIGNFHAGPFMGKYKDLSVVDTELSLRSVSINAGVAYTYSRDVVVSLAYEGTPTKYRIGETSDLSGEEWKDLTESIEFTLSEGYANKTIYAQVGNANESSLVVSSSIDYRKEPIATVMTLNNGKGLTTEATIPVSFAVTGVFTSLQYMLSENADFTGASYAPYTVNSQVNFTLSGKGTLTIYGRIKSDDGQEVNVQGTIKYVNSKCIISLFSYGWQNFGFDAENGVNKLKGWPMTNEQMLNVSGQNFCKFTMLSVSGWSAGSTDQAGTNTGNNSGAYPDIYLSKGIFRTIKKTAYDPLKEIVIRELPAGSYTVRILSNGRNTSNKMPTTVDAYYLINGVERVAADLGIESFENNHNDLAVFTNVVVGETGEMHIDFYSGGVSTNYPYFPVNVIELEKE